MAEGALAIFMGLAWFYLEPAKLHSFVLLVLVFTSQFRVSIVRERRHFWSSRPGRALLISSTATIIRFALMASSGILVPSLALNQVLSALALAAIFIFSLDFPKYYVFRKFGL